MFLFHPLFELLASKEDLTQHTSSSLSTYLTFNDRTELRVVPSFKLRVHLHFKEWVLMGTEVVVIIVPLLSHTSSKNCGGGATSDHVPQ